MNINVSKNHQFPPATSLLGAAEQRAAMHTDVTPADPTKLRELASWYREFAERTGNPTIWAARLRTAKELEAEADLVERTQANHNRAPPLRPRVQ
jgi:hypothetical protein